MSIFTALKDKLAKVPKKWLFTGVFITLFALPLVAFLIFSALLAKTPQTTTPNNQQAKSQTKDWSAENAKLAEAERLVSDNKLDEAKEMLNKIDKAYPQYNKVTELLEQIKTKQSEAEAEAEAKAEQEEQAKPRAAQPSSPAPQPAPRPAIPAFSTPITIKGDDACKADTLNALKAIANSAPGHYSVATRYISVIECVGAGSAMYANESPPRYAVGDSTRTAGTLWYASTIVHDANHSRLYHEGKTWTGGDAENICLDAQANSLALMGAAQSTIDYVNGMKGDPYWQTPVEDRYW